MDIEMIVDEGCSNSQTTTKTEQTSLCHTANDRDE